jgi:hypothetical protein
MPKYFTSADNGTFVRIILAWFWALLGTPSHDSRYRFSAGPRRSVHTMPFPGTHQPPPWCPGFRPLPLLLHTPTPCMRLTHLTLHVGSLTNTPLHLFLAFFLDQQNHSCSCLLLVRSVGVWETSGFILTHGETIVNEVHSSTSLPVSI